MKKLNFAILSQLFSAGFIPLCGQSLDNVTRVYEHVIESKWEVDSDHNRMLNYYNRDYCDYYLVRLNDDSYTLKPGKNTVFTIRADSEFDSQFKNAGSYHRYKGVFPQEFDISTPYALPVKDGKETAWVTDRRERRKTMRFRIEPGDTVCSTRYGVSCLTQDPRLLLVYHQDHTFAAYLMMHENFISPGETVIPGQPVGIAGHDGLAISFFFLDRNMFANAVADGYPYLHYVPSFSTSEGILQPEEKKPYVAVTDGSLVMREMSRREQKKYLRTVGGPEGGKARKPQSHEPAASLRITWLQDPVSEKDKERITGILDHELRYYERLGMDDDLTLTVCTFKDADKAADFLQEKFGRSVDVRYVGGIYMSREQTAVIIGYDEKKSERNVRIICHEISHHLLRNLPHTSIPAWLNEGLARYFENCTVDRRGNVAHSLSDAEKGRLRSAFMIGSVDIREFLDTPHKEFMVHQRTDSGIAYTLAHALVTVIVDNGCDGIVEALLNPGKGERSSDIVGRLYPGGVQGLEDGLMKIIGQV